MGLSAAQAQTPRIDAIEITGAGLVELSDAKATADKSISTGNFTRAKSVKIIQRASVIKTKKGMVIGMTVRVTGKPNGARGPVTVTWRYPEPGLKNPDTGDTKLTDEYETTEVIGKDSFFFWTFDAEWPLVPGDWTIELRSGGRLLAKQLFVLER